MPIIAKMNELGRPLKPHEKIAVYQKQLDDFGKKLQVLKEDVIKYNKLYWMGLLLEHPIWQNGRQK